MKSIYGDERKLRRVIEDETGRAVSIIEALNLDKYKAANIDQHVKKLLFDYECNGLKKNYIVVYVSRISTAYAGSTGSALKKSTMNPMD